MNLLHARWAHLLAPGDGEEGFRKPTKPGQCGDRAEAFAAIHCATPRIIVASSGAYKGFRKAIEDLATGNRQRGLGIM